MKRYDFTVDCPNCGPDESNYGDYVLYSDVEVLRMNVDEYLLNQLGMNDLQRQQAIDLIFE